MPLRRGLTAAGCRRGGRGRAGAGGDGTSRRPMCRASSAARRRSRPRLARVLARGAAQPLRGQGHGISRVRFPAKPELRLGRGAGATHRGGGAEPTGRGAHTPWAQSRRRYDAGVSLRSVDDIAVLDRVLRGAARAALRVPLEGLVGFQELPAFSPRPTIGIRRSRGDGSAGCSVCQRRIRSGGAVFYGAAGDQARGRERFWSGSRPRAGAGRGFRAGRGERAR